MMRRRSQIIVSAAGIAALMALGALLIYRLQPHAPQAGHADSKLLAQPQRAAPAQLPAPP
jgi:hypothetical protein